MINFGGDDKEDLQGYASKEQKDNVHRELDKQADTNRDALNITANTMRISQPKDKG
jgi:hypothetical protein